MTHIKWPVVTHFVHSPMKILQTLFIPCPQFGRSAVQFNPLAAAAARKEHLLGLTKK